MRSELTRGLRPMAAVLLLVLAIAAAVVGLTSSPQATAAVPEDCSTPTATVTVTETVTATAEPTATATATDDPTATAPTSTAPLARAGAAGAGETTPEDCESEEPTTPGEPSETTTTEPGDDGVIKVDDAVFRWGINNQSNARSHNPGSYNFFSAGVANPGRGGVQMLEKHWRATSGNVTVQKWMGSTKRWRTATWNGWKTVADTSTATGIDSNFSLHNIVVSNGTGTIDLGARTATIRWKGTFTVVYYGGNTIFTVTDPVLKVAGGKGTVTGALGGFASDRDDMSQWSPVPSKVATIATLENVKLSRSGFSTTPVYRGVVAPGFADQTTDGVWGAFPAGMLNFLKPLAISQFWYSTGLSTDDTKLPLPLTISFSAKEVTAPTPQPEKPKPTVTNPVNTPPGLTPPPVNNEPAPSPVGPVAPTAAATPNSPFALLAADDLTALRQVSAESSTQSQSDGRIWWVGGGLLFVAALTLLIPTPSARRP